jgi:DNA polymerase III delta prime subunit
MLSIHADIQERLESFRINQNVPHILFHGPSGGGKRTLVNSFINRLYNGDKTAIKEMTLYANCAQEKGIKFVREDLRLFAKTHIQTTLFKSVVLLNADKLTTDAQSALRRSIELFSHNTRFFIVAENKCKLLKPILSRFCEMHVPEPATYGNLYEYKLDKLNRKSKTLAKLIESNDCADLLLFSESLYEKGYSGLDVIDALDNCDYDKIVAFHRMRKECRNEKLLIMFVLHNSINSLEQFSFI